MHKLMFAGATVLGLIGLSAVLAQPLPREAPDAGGDAPRPAEIRSLRGDARAVRLLLGVGDAQPRARDGKVALDRGEIVGLEGWRFRAGDVVTGPDSWKARSMVLRKVADAKAVTKDQAGCQEEDRGGQEGRGRRVQCQRSPGAARCG